jgi:hypothetical protein
VKGRREEKRREEKRREEKRREEKRRERGIPMQMCCRTFTLFYGLFVPVLAKTKHEQMQERK